MPFTNKAAAAYGLLAMHAMDMYRMASNPVTPPPASGLTAAGWTIEAYITGDDTTLLRSATAQLQVLTHQTVFYGYLARRPSGELVAVIRDTDGFVEWLEDAEFRPIPYSPDISLPAAQDTILVERGFWALYASMQLINPAGAALDSFARAIVSAAGSTGLVTVVGHGVGSALATYLTLDLVRGGLGARVSACLFASPHAGNQAFVDLFDRTIADYRLFNYILDVVPRVPLRPGFIPLPRRTVILPTTAEARIRTDPACNHHVICYCAMLDYEGTIQATIPVPFGEAGAADCILGPR